jgi:hypothetical protein
MVGLPLRTRPAIGTSGMVVEVGNRGCSWSGAWSRSRCWRSEAGALWTADSRAGIARSNPRYPGLVTTTLQPTDSCPRGGASERLRSLPAWP